MTPFHTWATLAFVCWTILVVARYRRSIPVLMGGLLIAGLTALIAYLKGWVTSEQLGLAAPASWPVTVILAAAWTALMFVYSPIADWIATRFVAEPPDLEAFRALQESKAKLIAGIVVAWILGGFLEELVLRGVVLTAFDSWLGAGIAVVLAAIGAGVLHLYQGKRATIIVAQLSVLFGVLYVVSGRNLWAVILCHGFYDTIAFILFARKASKNPTDSELNRPSEPERFPMPSLPAIGVGVAAVCLALFVAPSTGRDVPPGQSPTLFWLDRGETS